MIKPFLPLAALALSFGAGFLHADQAKSGNETTGTTQDGGFADLFKLETYKPWFDFKYERHVYGPIGMRVNHFMYQTVHYPIPEKATTVKEGDFTSQTNVTATELEWKETHESQDRLYTNASNNQILVTMRYGLTDAIELQLGIAQLGASGEYNIVEDGLQQVGRRPKPGFADPHLGAKFQVWKSHDGATAVAFRALVQPELGQETGLKSGGETEGSTDFLFQHDFGPVVLHTNAGYVYASNIDLGDSYLVANPFWFGSVSLEIPFTVGSLLLQGHANESPFRQSTFDYLNNDVFIGLVGYQVRITKKMAFNIGMSIGSHSSFPESILTAGVTKEF